MKDRLILNEFPRLNYHPLTRKMDKYFLALLKQSKKRNVKPGSGTKVFSFEDTHYGLVSFTDESLKGALKQLFLASHRLNKPYKYFFVGYTLRIKSYQAFVRFLKSRFGYLHWLKHLIVCFSQIHRTNQYSVDSFESFNFVLGSLLQALAEKFCLEHNNIYYRVFRNVVVFYSNREKSVRDKMLYLLNSKFTSFLDLLPENVFEITKTVDEYM